MQECTNDLINLYDLKKKLLECYKLRGKYFTLERSIYQKVYDSYNKLDVKRGLITGKVHDTFALDKVLTMFIYRTKDLKYDIISFNFEDKKEFLYIKRDLERKKNFVFCNVSRDLISTAKEDIDSLFDLLDKHYDEIHLFDASETIEQSFFCDNVKASFFSDIYKTSIMLKPYTNTPGEYLKENEDEILENMTIPKDKLNQSYSHLYKS